MGDAPYRIRFDEAGCIGSGKCVEEAPGTWEMDLGSGKARLTDPLVSEEGLAENLRAARACPARNGRGVIRIVDRSTGSEISLDTQFFGEDVE